MKALAIAATLIGAVCFFGPPVEAGHQVNRPGCHNSTPPVATQPPSGGPVTPFVAPAPVPTLAVPLAVAPPTVTTYSTPPTVVETPPTTYTIEVPGQRVELPGQTVTVAATPPAYVTPSVVSYGVPGCYGCTPPVVIPPATLSVDTDVQVWRHARWATRRANKDPRPRLFGGRKVDGLEEDAPAPQPAPLQPTQ